VLSFLWVPLLSCFGFPMSREEKLGGVLSGFDSILLRWIARMATWTVVLKFSRLFRR